MSLTTYRICPAVNGILVQIPPAFVTYQKIRWRYIGLADSQPSQERYALLRLCQVLDSHAAEIHPVIIPDIFLPGLDPVSAL